MIADMHRNYSSFKEAAASTKAQHHGRIETMKGPAFIRPW